MHRLDFLKKNIKGSKVLDVGNLANGGIVHQMLINQFPEIEFYGLDPTDQQRQHLSFANQTIGVIEKNRYPDNFFDTIYIGEVIEHTWTPKEATDQCYRILKSNGVLILDTPNIYSLSRMLRYFFTGKDIILGDPDHKLFFSRAMIEHLLQSSGFRIIEITSEVNFDTMRFKSQLPNIGTFRYMGECLLVRAEK